MKSPFALIDHFSLCYALEDIVRYGIERATAPLVREIGALQAEVRALQDRLPPPPAVPTYSVDPMKIAPLVGDDADDNPE